MVEVRVNVAVAVEEGVRVAVLVAVVVRVGVAEGVGLRQPWVMNARCAVLFWLFLLGVIFGFLALGLGLGGSKPSGRGKGKPWVLRPISQRPKTMELHQLSTNSNEKTVLMETVKFTAQNWHISFTKKAQKMQARLYAFW